MRIDRIVKNKKNTNILYSYGEKAAVLKDYELVKYNIQEDTELSEETYNTLLSEVLYPRAYMKAVDWLAAYDRSTYEITKKLSDYGFPDIIIEKVIEELNRRHFLDDIRYAENFISTKSTSKSINEIKYMLKNKGIDKNIIENLIADSEITDEKVAEALILKKIKKKDMTDRKEQMKVIASVCNKGFQYETVRKLLERIINEQND